jgi:hypothetical protein
MSNQPKGCLTMVMALFPGGKAGLLTKIGRGGPPPTAPVKTGNPVIAGTAQVGQTLAATRGSYTGIIGGYSSQWYSGAAPIAFATTQFYVVQPGDLGANISYREYAYNIAGASAVGISNALGPVIAAGGGGGGGGAAPALKFNVTTNSQYVPLAA